MYPNKTVVGNSSVYAVLGVYTGSSFVAALNSGGVSVAADSFVRVNRNIVHAQFVFQPGTSAFQTGATGEWYVATAGIPAPVGLSATFRVCGTAEQMVYGNEGSDYIMEYNQSVGGFKFLLNHHGFLSILNTSNQSSYLRRFFNDLGTITVNLEYEIA